jgi:hypothetical protein
MIKSVIVYSVNTEISYISPWITDSEGTFRGIVNAEWEAAITYLRMEGMPAVVTYGEDSAVQKANAIDITKVYLF